MNDAQLLDVVAGALAVAAKLSGPLLLTTLAIGVGVSLLQAVTQVQEMSLTFVPKLIGVAVVVVVLGSWMIREFVGWVTALWGAIPGLT